MEATRGLASVEGEGVRVGGRLGERERAKMTAKWKERGFHLL